jgi:uncharacterized protein YndB with AHSA1/START domain
MRSVIIESVEVRAGGRLLHFDRRLNAPPQAVWAALTEPEKVRQWYATINDYPQQGQPMQLRFENSNTTVTATVTRLTRPAVLEYTWDNQVPAQSPVSLVGSVIRFELTPHDAGTVLTLDHILTTDSMPLSDILGGWHTHLDELAQKINPGAPAAAGAPAGAAPPLAAAAMIQAEAQPLAVDFLARCSSASKVFARALAVPSVQP